MRLSQHHTALVQAALREVRNWADAAAQSPDTASARTALASVRDACLRAADTLNDCERETREAALAKLEQAA